MPRLLNPGNTRAISVVLDLTTTRAIWNFDFDQAAVSSRLLPIPCRRCTTLSAGDRAMDLLRWMPSVVSASNLTSLSRRSQKSVGKRLIIQCASMVLCLLLWSALNIVTPVFAEPTEWAPSLRKQLQAEKACQFLYMLNVKEYRFLDHDVIEAKVHCEDGRIFDVTRRSPEVRFEIKECSLNTC